MNWKFWEWEIWKEDEPTPRPLPMTDDKNVLVLEDPIERPRTQMEMVQDMAAARKPIGEMELEAAKVVATRTHKMMQQRKRDAAAIKVLESRKQAERDRKNMNANRK